MGKSVSRSDKLVRFFRNKTKQKLVIGIVSIVSTLTSVAQGAEPRELASRIYSRLASAPLGLKDPKRAQIETLISQGNFLGAAQVATTDDRFYNTTVRTFATAMSNRSEDPVFGQGNLGNQQFLTDFVAMVIGTVRDDRNAQELLTADFTYYVDETIAGLAPYKPITVDNNDSPHFKNLYDLNINLRQKLVRKSPQRPDFSDAAGVLTSQGWGWEHLNNGTNRRPIAYALKEFLCVDLEELRDTALPTTRIRQDVSRTPGGSATTFQTKCLTCHGGMDGLAGAYAYYDEIYISSDTFTTDLGSPAGYFFGSQLARRPSPLDTNTSVVSKMVKNSSTYSAGYKTIDDSWVNSYATSTTSKSQAIGWPTTTTGKGVRSLGTMLANTKAFPRCMAQRVFRTLCGRNPDSTEIPRIQQLGDEFSAGGFKLKSLFEKVAIEPTCIGR